MSKTRPVLIGGVTIGGEAPLALIAGPCVIESPEHVMKMAEAVAQIAGRVKMPFIFKASFDKANRSSIQSYRGPGMDAGLELLAAVRGRVGCPVLTDIHAVDQVSRAADAVDAMQIPAFLCRQTDLLISAGETGLPVNVKKGQFLAPWDMKQALAKIESTGNRNILLTERGASFGYNNLVSDMRSLVIMRETGYPVIYDATHSVQLPGGQGTSSGGQREFIAPLSRAAVAAGIDAIFIETHDDPSKALSDGPNSVPLEELEELLRTLVRLHIAVRAPVE
ncbi:3-deoxy-8-phosphooctulonate synthase [Candidatus Sumerlaeota bacterium]|nr:3-deoxy-8-phosphooctulonate synthase [Candidatus Sumerlaeota bacterium]